MVASSSKTSNPFFDAWWAGTEQLVQTQSEWFSSPLFSSSTSDSNSIFEGAEENWQKCQEQFNAWLAASGEWLQGVEQDAVEKDDFSSSMAALKSLLNPMSFFNSGLLELDHVFQKMIEVPDFADIGVYEKKFLHINKAWQDCQTASTDYHAILSSTWAEAFKEYTSQLSSEVDAKSLQPKELLKQWMNVANDLLIQMQRSDAFLDAQNKLVEANTKLKLQQKEMTASWCEAMMIPSRDEIDDLHQIIYDLRRQVRSLQRQVDREQKTKAEPAPKKAKNSIQKVAQKKQLAKKKPSIKKDSKKVTKVKEP